MPEITHLFSKVLVPEMTAELEKTRRVLVRVQDGVPAAQANFRPHPKSTPLLALANHLTTVSGLCGTVMTANSADAGGPTDPRRIVKEAEIAGILRVFDELAARSLRSLESAADESFLAPWQLTRQGRVMFEGTRYAALRNLCLNHMIHHRAQLTSYLRLLEIPVPALYGPTADET